MTEVEHTQNQLVSCLVETAREENPSVPEGVFARLEELLNGQISEQTLTPTTLRALAKQLIGDMGCQSG